MSATTPATVLAFGEFVLDVGNARLTRGGNELPLSRKPFALLTELIARPGELVGKDHLLDTVWGRRFVSDSAVKSVLSELRAVLGDDARAPRWIETVQARGYRFVGTVRREARSPSTPGAAAGNLPALPTPLVGRDDDLARLLPALRTQPPPLLTLTGPAGVGKSLLALHLARELRPDHADGAFRVELAGLPPNADAAALRGTIAHALRLADAATRDDESLARSLEGLSLLLLLDNAEHVVEPLAPLLAQLLAHREPANARTAPHAGVRLMVTSREPLRLPAEQVVTVPPLSVPAVDDEHDPARVAACGAPRLFLDRVSASLPDHVLRAEDAPALAQLCRMLDGLPLALELAAARVPALGLQGLRQRLAGTEGAPPAAAATATLQLLGPGLRRDEPRYRTLREALDWSHALLSHPQQRLLRRLAVFRGPCELAAAQRVCADAELDEWQALDALQALVERSLVIASTAEPRRYTLLHSVRAYAHERLVDAGELQPICRSHFDAQLAYWRAADARALGEPALQWVQAHDAALPDLRATLAWGCDAVCAEPPRLTPAELLALAGACGLVWHRAGHAGEGLRWCERVLALAGPSADTAARAGVELALAHLGGIAMVMPALQGLAAARRAAQAYAAAGDAVRETYALYLQHTLMCRAEPDAPRAAVLERMRQLAQPAWSDLLRRFERSAVAYEARLQGRTEDYRRFNAEELARCRAIGAQWEAWSAGIGLMLAEHDGGRLAEAVVAGRAVLDDIRAAGRLRQNANRLAMWIMMLAESGHTGATRTAMHEALPILHGAGRGGMALLSAAWLAAHEGHAEVATLLLARFDAPGRTGAEFGPGTFIRRSVGRLWAELRGELGDDALARQRAAADEVSDRDALQRALAAA